jgi:phosphatidylglycerol:prolipoprotein diacylglycerol transferase
LCAYFVLEADLKRRHIEADAAFLIAVPTLCGIVGAKLYHVLESPRELVADPVGQIFSQTGFAWLGGLIAGMAAFVYLGHKYRIPTLLMFDIASPATALAYGIGSIGCLLSGDGDYGVPTSLPWGMSFPNGLVPTTARVHPTPIYELAGAVLIALWLWHLGKPKKTDAAVGPGRVFAAYLIATGAARFLVEFIRINPRSFLGMSNAQAGSLLSILLGIGVAVYVRKQRETILDHATPTARAKAPGRRG